MDNNLAVVIALAVADAMRELLYAEMERHERGSERRQELYLTIERLERARYELAAGGQVDG